MKKILLILLLIVLRGTIYSAPTPTPTPVYSITAANALGLYAAGTTQAIIVTMTASDCTNAYITSIPCRNVIIEKSDNGLKTILIIVGTSSQITAAKAMAKLSVITPVQESNVATQFANFAVLKQELCVYLNWVMP